METNNYKFNVLSLSTDAYVQTNSDIGIELNGSVPFSIGAWIRLNGLGYETSIISKADVFNLGINANTVVCQISGYPTVQSNLKDQPIVENQWLHVCVTFDGTQLRVYIDGLFNTLVSIMGSGNSNTNPYLIGQYLQGEIRQIQIYNRQLDADEVLDYMYNEPKDLSSITAYFDFTQNPPVDISMQKLPLILKEDAVILTKYPALALSGVAYAQPQQDEAVNPGGYQNDAYTVQSWVYVSSKLSLKQMVFVNSDLEKDTGMALFIEYDDTSKGFRVKSQRGSDNSADDILSSDQLIQQNKWTNIATTFDGVNLAIYIDGVLDKIQQFPPIPQMQLESNLLIGAALAQGRPTGANVLKGYISRIDVWDIALNKASIGTYMDNIPDIPMDNLTACYNFMTDVPQNSVNGNPIGFTNKAVLDFQTSKAEQNATSDKVFSESKEYEISPELLQSFRNSVNFTDIVGAAGSNPFAKNKESEMEFASQFIEESDLPSFKAKIEKAWDDMEDRLRTNPRSIPFAVTHHKVDGYHYIVCHNQKQSYVAGKIKIDSISEYDVWLITLIFTVIAGILSLFGICAKLSDKASAFIQKILTNPKIMALLSKGSTMSASAIFAIAGALFTGGFLVELLKLVMPKLTFWGVICLIANVLLMFLPSKAVQVILSLAITAINFISVYLQKPKDKDELPKVVITAITFYNPDFGNQSAIKIRKNAIQAITTPEWVPGNIGNSDSPAAYCISNGNQVYVKAKFINTTEAPVRVRANLGGILGPIIPFIIPIGNSEIPILLNIAFANNGVMINDIEWNWQYMNDSVWINMETTKHRIYTLLETPTAPWQLIPVSNDNQQLPWTDVLNYACNWANGAISVDDASSIITKEINGGLGLQYNGSRHYLKGDEFKCSDFIKYINSPELGDKYVNCEDCAVIVLIFSNILGCKLASGRINGPFKYNKIQQIGNPNWNSGSFANHYVAWKNGQMGFCDFLFDACLHIDGSDNPWGDDNVKVPLLPSNYQFSNNPKNVIIDIPVPLFYRERLASNDDAGIPKCLLSNYGSRTQFTLI